jgi:hypothetical protein
VSRKFTSNSSTRRIVAKAPCWRSGRGQVAGVKQAFGTSTGERPGMLPAARVGDPGVGLDGPRAATGRRTAWRPGGCGAGHAAAQPSDGVQRRPSTPSRARLVVAAADQVGEFPLCLGPGRPVVGGADGPGLADTRSRQLVLVGGDGDGSTAGRASALAAKRAARARLSEAGLAVMAVAWIGADTRPGAVRCAGR